MPKAKHAQMDFRGLEIVADEFTGTFNGTIEVDPASITIAADATSTLPSGNLQNVLEGLAARIAAVEEEEE